MKFRQTIIAAIALIMGLIIVTACGGGSKRNESTETDGQQTEEAVETTQTAEQEQTAETKKWYEGDFMLTEKIYVGNNSKTRIYARKGNIVIDCQTLGQNVIYVKIGSREPQQVETATKQQMAIPYEVSEPTRIYVYAAPKNAAAAPQKSNQSRHTPRRTAYANDNAVKLYGLTINVDENLSGISSAKLTGAPADGTWYTIDGRRVAGKPAKKGIYVKNGKKVVIR